MQTPIFRRVMVPIEFEPAGDTEIAADRSFELTPGRWVVAAPATMRALRLASLLAEREVQLVHATPDIARAAIYGGPEAAWLPDGTLLELEKMSRKHAEGVLQAVGRSMLGGLEVSYRVESGRPLDVIVDAVTEQPPDAIVLAASARGRIRRAMVGSTADRLIRLAFCPVIVVPATHD